MPTIDAPAEGPLRTTAEGVLVALRVQPNASRTQIDGVTHLADGSAVLKVRVGAPPEEGQANAAVTKLLAKAWGIPKGRITITQGATTRAKTLLVRGEPGTLASSLRQWLARLG